MNLFWWPVLCLAAAGMWARSAPQTCSISGRVVDDHGRPVKFAAVNALREPVSGLANGTFGAMANERGEYCISVMPAGADLPPGRYRVRAIGGTMPRSASPSCRSCCGAATGLLTTSYPNALSPERATPVILSPGRPVAGIDIRLRRGPVYCVQGEVRDASGALVHRATLTLRMDRGPSAGVINEGGRFLLTNLEPGVYTLVLTDRPQFGRTLAQRSFEIRDRNLEQFVITSPE